MAEQTVEEHLKCPICHEIMTGAIETSCGHAMCGSCLSEWYLSKCPNQNSKACCPVCRSAIILVIKSFSLRSQARILKNQTLTPAVLETIAAQDNKWKQYNEKFCGAANSSSHSVLQEININYELFQMMMNTFWKWIVYLLVAILVIYIVFPIDLIPDTAGIAGFIDDLLMMVAVIYMAWVLLQFFRSRLFERM